MCCTAPAKSQPCTREIKAPGNKVVQEELDELPAKMEHKVNGAEKPSKNKQVVGVEGYL